VSKLKELLLAAEPDEISKYHTMKFIYPMGLLKTLDMEHTFE